MRFTINKMPRKTTEKSTKVVEKKEKKVVEKSAPVEVPAPVVVEEKKKRPVSKWILATMEFNKGREKYLIPKKGTPEYEEVLKIYERMKKE